MTAQEAVITEQVKNKKTKDRITETALRLFAANGFSGTSMQDIAAELGITKAALYKHFSGKQEIFDSIICRMQEKDYENAHSCGVPEGTIEEMSDSYASVSPESIIVFSKEMFRYWTEEEFPSLFRKMLTLEQYSSAEMRELYCQYISSGPLEYVRDMFFSVYSDADSAKAAALEYYGPLFLLYSIYDSSEDKPAVTAAADRHIDSFFDRNKKSKGAERKQKEL